VIADPEILARLALAAGLGAAIGFEREVRNRSAGIRTHTLVGLGAAIFSIAGAYGFADVNHGPNVDPARIAAQVVSGIGFIGAGAIIQARGGVRGVTTAATLWVTAALGVAAAAGLYAEAIAGAVMALLTLVGLRLVRPHVMRFRSTTLTVEYTRGRGTLGPLVRAIEQVGGTIEALHLDDEDEDAAAGVRRAVVRGRFPDDEAVVRVIETVEQRPELLSLEAEPPPSRVAGRRVSGGISSGGAPAS
jgi:putative Mg2+ transporter-C (MgtC) family protein